MADDAGTVMASILKDFWYDEGWAFELSMRDDGPYLCSYSLAVLHSVPDVTTGRKIPVGGVYKLPPCGGDSAEGTREYLLKWLMNIIIELEIHEAMEKFEVGGKAVFHPHGPGGATYSYAKLHPDPPVTNRKPGPQLELTGAGYTVGRLGLTPSWALDRPAREMAELRSLARMMGKA